MFDMENGTIVYFPSLAYRSEKLIHCLHLGWVDNNQIFVVSSFNNSNKGVVTSVLEKVGYFSRIKRIWVISELAFDENNNLKITKNGNTPEDALLVLYNYTTFDMKTTDLTDRLQDNDSSGIVINCMIATCIKQYLDKILKDNENRGSGIKDLEIKSDLSLNGLKTITRRSDKISTLLWFYNCVFNMITLRLSSIVNSVFKNTRHVQFIRQSKLLTLLSKRLKIVSSWSNNYESLQRETDLYAYLNLENKIYYEATFLYCDLIFGILEYIYLKDYVTGLIFKSRVSVKKFYIKHLKSIFYYLTKRIVIYCKINNEIAIALSKFILNKIMLWDILRPKFMYIVSLLFKSLQYISLFGFSLQLALFLDIFTLETIQLMGLYHTILLIMRYTQDYLYSLLLLFKGKKWNVITSNIDTTEFTKEELFVGIIIFIIFMLNYPTIWLFYISVIIIVIPILVAKAILNCIVELVLNLPIYTMVYNFVFRKKFRESIYFDVLDIGASTKESQPNTEESKVVIMEICPTPIELTKYSNMMVEELKYVNPLTLLNNRVLVMPNTTPEVSTCRQALDYRDSLLRIEPRVDYLMTLYLSDNVSIQDLKDNSKECHVQGIKCYPAGVTTNSTKGFLRLFDKNLERYYELFSVMEKLNLSLHIHGESPKSSPLTAEEDFLINIENVCRSFPNLKVVLEHVSSRKSVDMVHRIHNLGATITPQHMVLTVDDVLSKTHDITLENIAGHIKDPYAYCKPIAKSDVDREAIREAIKNLHPRIFLGSDSAPHYISAKESDRPPAGIYTQPFLINYLANIFADCKCLENLEQFTSINGATFLQLPNKDRETFLLDKIPFKVPYDFGGVRPFMSGVELCYSMVEF